MRRDALILGFDIGTSSVKGALYDLQGTCLLQQGIGYRQEMTNPGWLEQDPDDWLRGMQSVVACFREKTGESPIAAIGICSQVNTHVFVDESGRPLRRAIVWQDQRCAGVAEELRTQALRDAAGADAPLDASSVLSRAEWIRQFEPEVWTRTRWILSPKDYCILALTGCAVSDAMTSIGVVNADGEYRRSAIGLVSGLEQRLPPLRALTACAGRARVDWLPDDIPVGTGTMDAWAASVGSGARAAGDAFQVAGTSEVIGMLSTSDQGGHGVVTFPRFNGLRLHAGPTQAGGDALKWFAGAVNRDITQVLAMATMPAAPDEPLLFLPYLMGERAPLWDAEARGAFIGLSKRHRESDMALAVLRGVAMSARHLLEAVEQSARSGCEDLRISGGASRSDLWCQIKADVMNRTLYRVQNRDSSMFGAAMLACAGTDGDMSPGGFGVAPVPVERAFQPDPALGSLYDELFAAYRSAYEGLGPAFSALARARAS